MNNTDKKLDFAQIAWVVKEVETAKTFFQEMLGVSNFSQTVTTRLKEYDGNYYDSASVSFTNFLTGVIPIAIWRQKKAIRQLAEHNIPKLPGR